MARLLRLRWLAVAALVVLSWQCAGGEGPTNAPTETPVASITLQPGGAVSLPLGGLLQASAVPRDSLGASLDRPVRWSSSDSSLARVTTGGLVRAVGMGTATITAEAGGVSPSFTVAIRDSADIALVSLQAEPVLIEIEPGESALASVSGHDAFGNRIDSPRGAVWRITNPLAATSSGPGVVTANGPGSALLTVSVQGLIDTIPVHVPLRSPSTARLALQLDPGLPAGWAEAFALARSWWEQVFTAELPPADYDLTGSPCAALQPRIGTGERGIRILVRLVGSVSNGRPAGANTCRVRQSGDTLTTIAGYVLLDSVVLTWPGAVSGSRDELITLASLAAHEIGHVLGLAFDPGQRGAQVIRYRGAWGLAAYRMLYPAATEPLVANPHWEAPVEDVMRGQWVRLIGPVSLGALIDNGYPVSVQRPVPFQ